MSMVGFPLLLIPLAIYNIIVFLMPGVSLVEPVAKLTLIGDPGRSYLDRDRLESIAEYEVPVTRALEDADVKRASIWRFKTVG